jgi:hypothetical protein
VQIDVEGFEADVLLGMSKTIERDRPAMYLEVHPPGFCGNGNPQKVCSLLKTDYTNICAFRIWCDVRRGLPKWARIRALLGADHTMRRECEATLAKVMENQQYR